MNYTEQFNRAQAGWGASLDQPEFQRGYIEGLLLILRLIDGNPGTASGELRQEICIAIGIHSERERLLHETGYPERGVGPRNSVEGL
jgi:hypothetical protein